MSLREPPQKQAIFPGRWNRFRYVPLVTLVIVALIAAAVGVVTSRRIAAELAEQARAAAKPVSVGSVGSNTGDQALPTICHPAIPAPATEPWTSGDTAKAKAEAVWNSHQSELSSAFVREKDGWYDWGDVQAANFSQAIGRRNLSIAEAKLWHDHLATLRDKLAAMHIPLYIVVTPAKWDVYPQELPDWAQSIRGSGPLDQLLAAYPDLPIVDLRSDLRAASATNQTYSETNSHWTDYGAYVGWKTLASCITASSPALHGLSAEPIDGVTVTADHNEFAPFGVPDPAPNWTSPDYAAPLDDVTVTDGKGVTSTVSGTTETDLLSLPAKTTTVGAETDLSALLVRDSFGNSLSVPIQQAFGTTWQVRHNLDSPPSTQPDIPALAAADHPSVVILQIAERHLNFVPPS